MADLDAIFKAYDIRGTFPNEIDAEGCRAIGAAFARFALDEGGAVPEILVGRDMRPSGAELAEAFSDGVRSQGVDVVDLGLASTDLVYFASGSRGAPGAMFTASHNPAQYNGIKFCLAGARPVGADTGLDRIKELARTGVAPTERRGNASKIDLLGSFAEHVRSFVDVSKFRPLKVVADTANGMGGLVVPAVFEALPFELEILYPELDGTFPNHPADPIQPENQRDLQARVRDVGADVGFAFDGDADRVFVVDEQGNGLSGSVTTAMVAVGMLEKEPGGTVLHNLICSKTVPEVVREHGGTPVRTKVGHSFIKAEMAATGAVFGGEHSAHYYFRDNYRADSGLIASMMVLERLCAGSEPMSALRAPYDRYADSGEINTQVNDPAAVIDAVAAEFARRTPSAAQDRLDGLTVDFGDWWFNLRPSNTEPLLRLNLEARTRDECDEHTSELLHLITKG
ncbi:MAG: phosphomannomutase/phosphoglucomutase [Acidimicrobiales bacterium]|nr:phosphomannomutase/phosphoglucomutase [Acidimicrobiales bacterium]